MNRDLVPDIRRASLAEERVQELRNAAERNAAERPEWRTGEEPYFDVEPDGTEDGDRPA